jgi:MATE family multidrug resistance protein
MFSFAPGEGWVNFLPHFGWGTIGGWWASLAYIFLLGVMMLSRWHSAAWRRIEIYR